MAQALGRAAIQQGHRVVYREAHALLEELAAATLDGTRRRYLAELTAVPLLIVDDLGMRKLPHTAAEDLLEVIMRRYERAGRDLPAWLGWPGHDTAHLAEAFRCITHIPNAGEVMQRY